MRDRVFTLHGLLWIVALLALLLVALLILAPRHPWPDWRVPIYVFCGATLIWLAPELWALRPRKRKLSTNLHKFRTSSYSALQQVARYEEIINKLKSECVPNNHIKLIVTRMFLERAQLLTGIDPRHYRGHLIPRHLEDVGSYCSAHGITPYYPADWKGVRVKDGKEVLGGEL